MRKRKDKGEGHLSILRKRKSIDEMINECIQDFYHYFLFFFFFFFFSRHKMKVALLSIIIAIFI